MTKYRCPIEIYLHEIEIKRSRFIAQAIPLSDIDQLQQLQAQLRVTHNRASHHCLAYVLGAPAQPKSAGSSDDGEPSGTAGKPMLNVLLQQQIGDVGVVVTRYFGGIKLGAGGLIRAYAQSVSELVKLMPLQQVEIKKEVRISYPYSLEPQINRLVSQTDTFVVDEKFSETIHKTLRIVETEHLRLIASLAELAHLGVFVDSD